MKKIPSNIRRFALISRVISQRRNLARSPGMEVTFMKDTFRFSAVVGSALLLAALTIPLTIPVAVQAGVTWKVNLGAQSKNMGRQAMAFLPNEIWIYVGDSITWTSKTDANHTVTFLKQVSGGAAAAGTTRPSSGLGCTGGSQGGASVATANGSAFNGLSCVNSDILTAGQSYTVTFPNAGNYKLVCLIHRDMTGAVHVLPLAANLPFIQSDYDKLVADETHDLIDDTDRAKARNGNPGTGINQVIMTGEFVATGGGKSYLAIMRFLPSKIVVHAGDTVEWTNADPSEPHTVTFSQPGVRGSALEPVALIGVTPDDDGAQHGTLPNAAGTAVACGAGTSCFNTGVISAARQDQTAQTALGVTRARVTFSTPGTYDYYCILHDDLGMVGTVVVLE
jgi:plastocyanin